MIAYCGDEAGSIGEDVLNRRSRVNFSMYLAPFPGRATRALNCSSRQNHGTTGSQSVGRRRRASPRFFGHQEVGVNNLSEPVDNCVNNFCGERGEYRGHDGADCPLDVLGGYEW